MLDKGLTNKNYNKKKIIKNVIFNFFKKRNFNFLKLKII